MELDSQKGEILVDFSLETTLLQKFTLVFLILEMTQHHKILGRYYFHNIINIAAILKLLLERGKCLQNKHALFMYTIITLTKHLLTLTTQFACKT